MYLLQSDRYIWLHSPGRTKKENPKIKLLDTSRDQAFKKSSQSSERNHDSVITGSPHLRGQRNKGRRESGHAGKLVGRWSTLCGTSLWRSLCSSRDQGKLCCSQGVFTPGKEAGDWLPSHRIRSTTLSDCRFYLEMEGGSKEILSSKIIYFFQ